MHTLVATPLYASFFVLLALVLSLRVIRVRRGRGISLGMGGDDDLTRAVRAHGNLVEHMPLAVLLMAFVELNGGSGWWLHIAGATLVLGRCVHAWSLPAASGSGRVVGMAMTFTSWMLLVLANVVTVL